MVSSLGTILSESGMNMVSISADLNPNQGTHLLVLFVCVLAAPHGSWDLSSPTRDRTRASAVKAQSTNHGTAKELPSFGFLMY